MESLRTAVAADQLSSVLTRRALVIVYVMGLRGQILITRRPTAGIDSVEAAWRLYSICEWLPLAAKDALDSFGSSCALP